MTANGSKLRTSNALRRAQLGTGRMWQPMIRRGNCPVRVFLGLWLGLGVSTVLGTVGALAAGAPDPNAPEQAKSILADQIRDQGYVCDRAEEAHRDEALSKPDEPVWTLRCGNAAYRIRLRGNMAAEVEVLEVLESQP